MTASFYICFHQVPFPTSWHCQIAVKVTMTSAYPDEDIPAFNIEYGNLSMLDFSQQHKLSLLQCVTAIAEESPGSPCVCNVIQGANNWLTSGMWQSSLVSACIEKIDKQDISYDSPYDGQGLITSACSSQKWYTVDTSEDLAFEAEETGHVKVSTDEAYRVAAELQGAIDELGIQSTSSSLIVEEDFHASASAR